MKTLRKLLWLLPALLFAAALPQAAAGQVTTAMMDSINKATGEIPCNNQGCRNARTRALNVILRYRQFAVPPAPPPPPPPPLDTAAVSASCTPRSGQAVQVGGTLQFACTVKDSAGSARAWAGTWSSSSAAATVTQTGLARGAAIGRAWVRFAVNARPSVRDSVPLDVVAAPQPIPDPTEPGLCTRTIANVTIQGNLLAVPGERLCLGAGVQVRGNVLVKDAVLQARDGFSLTFLGAVPDAYVGGGIEYSAALDSDIGLWVWGSGQLDIACSAKLGWNRTGVDPTWRPGDEYWVTPTAVGDFEPRRWTPGQAVPNVGGGMPSAEIVNVTRPCSITGPGHIHVHSNKPQRVENVTLRNLGVSNAASRGHVLGRYVLHFHLSGDGTRGSVVRGVAAVGSQGKVFVPHASHGITMVDNVSVNSWGEGLWWDHGHATNDLLVDRMLVCGVELPDAISGSQSGIPAYSMVAGTNTEMRNSVACGARGSGTYAIGFDWPEPTAVFQPVIGQLVWRFDRGNVAHNNRASGVRFWNNNTHPHAVRDYTSYRNAAGSIDNGAYLNANFYDGVTSFEDGYVYGNDMSSNRSAITWNNSGTPGELGLSPSIRNFRASSLGGSALVIGHRQLGTDTYTEFVNCTLTPGAGQPKVFVTDGVFPARVRFTGCNLLPEEITFDPDPDNNGSVILINHPDGRRWEVRFENGQKVVRQLGEQQQQGAAELPRVRLNTAMPATTGTRRVASGGDLQAALNAAQAGDRVLLAPGATYTGNFVLPVKAGAGWVVVQTEAMLPPEGTRVTPQTSASFARLVTPNADPALATANGAARWRFVGVQIHAASSVRQMGTLVKLGDGGTASPAASDVTLDRVHVWGGDELDFQRCIDANAARVAIVDSWIAGCHGKGFDSQAILAYNTPGPLLIRNNYLEGAGENFMAGGADARSPEMMPADVEFVGNTVVKPAAWFTSQRWTAKNLFEIKAGTRFLVEGNTFDGNWRDGQTGQAFQLFSVNQDGTAPFTYVSDVTIRKNVIRNVSGGFNLTDGYGTVAAQLARVVIEDNRFESIGGASPYTSADESRHLVAIVGTGMRDLRIRHNTYAAAGLSNQVVFEGTVPGFVFENNVIGPAEYGFQNAGELATVAPGGIVRGNILAPATWNDQLPPGNCIAWPPSSATACPGAGAR